MALRRLGIMGIETQPRGRARPATWRMLPELREGEPRDVTDIRDALIIREGGLFLLTDKDGDVPCENESGFGLYSNDARYLSAWQLSLVGVEPVVLLSTAELGFAMEQVMTNPELVNQRGERLRSGVLELRRQRVLDQALVESLRVANFSEVPVSLTVEYRFGADFRDIFELRGVPRTSHGRVLPLRIHHNGVTFRYLGLDRVARQTRVRFRHAPDELSAYEARFHLEVPPSGSRAINALVLADAIAGTASTRRSIQDVATSYTRWKASFTSVQTSHELLNAALDRSLSDLRALWTEDSSGKEYVAAGVPWFDTLFGRDSILTAIMCLPYAPHVARSVLIALAQYQGTVTDDSREEQPGKIVHEIRRCETANTGEVVSGRYYGSIDCTPLFVLLAAEYYRWTADLPLMKELRNSIDAALDWIDDYGERDGDGYLEYLRKAPAGLENQGWKDSWDAIVDESGELLAPPIALVEVQGYVYAAKKAIAGVYEALGIEARASSLTTSAVRLRRRINTDFWMPEGYFALALDRNKKPARVLTSNAGQLLWTGAPTREKARNQIRRLMKNDMFTGWGVRTHSSGAARYNPLGYHLGTIWPHDNALIAAGLKRYGAESEVHQITNGICQAAFNFPYYRLPELFSGSPRTAHQAPVPYPVACRPQAFAAAALPSLLSTTLGLVADAPRGRIYLVKPSLPLWLDRVRLSGLRLGEHQVDLEFKRHGRRTLVGLPGRTGPIEVKRLRQWPQQ